MFRWLIAIAITGLVFLFQNCGHNSALEYGQNQVSGFSEISSTSFKSKWATRLSAVGNKFELISTNLNAPSFTTPVNIDLSSRYAGAIELRLENLPVGDVNNDGMMDALISARYAAQSGEPKLILDLVSVLDGRLLLRKEILGNSSEQLQPLMTITSHSASDGLSYIAVPFYNSSSSSGRYRFEVFSSDLKIFKSIRSIAAHMTLFRDLNADQVPEFIKGNSNGTMNIYSGAELQTSGSDLSGLIPLLVLTGNLGKVISMPDLNKDGVGDLMIESHSASEQVLEIFNISRNEQQQLEISSPQSASFNIYMPLSPMSYFGHFSSKQAVESVALSCQLSGGQCSGFQPLSFSTTGVTANSDSNFVFSPTHPANKGSNTTLPAIQVTDVNKDSFDEILAVYSVTNPNRQIMRIYEPKTGRVLSEQEFGEFGLDTFSFIVLSKLN